MRDSMIFYRSFFEAMEDLSIEDKGYIYEAIFNYGLNFKTSDVPKHLKPIFTLIKPQIDANIKKYNNGKKPKLKQRVSEPEANVNYNANVNLNVNDKEELVPINDKYNEDPIALTLSKLGSHKVEYNRKSNEELLLGRKEKFVEDVKQFDEIYIIKVIDEFIDYWTEPNKAKTKMRFEMQSTWDTKRRLKLWNDRHWEYERKKEKIVKNSRNDAQVTAVSEFRKKLLQQIAGKH